MIHTDIQIDRPSPIINYQGNIVDVQDLWLASKKAWSGEAVARHLADSVAVIPKQQHHAVSIKLVELAIKEVDHAGQQLEAILKVCLSAT
jgi:hypothetical protein